IAASRRQRGLFDAVGAPPAAHDSAPSYAKAMLDALGELLAAAQRAGAVRTEVTVHDVKALIAGVKSAEELGGEPDRLLTVVTRGLRT
ncbi:MAG: hypothetical protein ACRDMV_16640, partial [Streptosporangiales bacterium]